MATDEFSDDGAADGVVRVGVVAVQGDVAEHRGAVDRAADALGLAVETVAVRDAGVLPDCDVAVLPGGESTTISSLIHREGIADEIRAHVDDGKPVLATCAGLIVLARDAGDDERVETLDLLGVTVQRNAYGRQRESFEADVALAIDDAVDSEPFHAVFIRAPRITDHGDARVVGRLDDEPVAVAQGPVLATSFHPELTDDPRIHAEVLAQT